MHIVNKPYMSWSSAARKRLRNLSLRSEGDMCKTLTKRACDSFVVFDGQTIVGWAVYVLEPWYGPVPGDFMIYVRKSYRQRGVGRMLIKAAIDKYGTVRIHAWDGRSGKFFSKMIGEEGDSLYVARGQLYI